MSDIDGHSVGTGLGAERVPVLMYHRVDLQEARHAAGYCVTPRQFESHLHTLAEQGCQPCSMGAFDRWYRGEAELPPRSVLITFDDGFSGVHQHAWPLLQARGWPATVFLVSGLIGQRDAWISKEFGIAGSNALLDKAQIAEMALHGIEFHSHTRTHADLSVLGDQELMLELLGSRQDLQALLGTPVDFLAYPFGRSNERVRAAAAAAGYRLGFSVDPGFNRPGVRPFEVRRLDITGHDTRARFARKLAMGTNDGSLGRHLQYLARRVATRLGA